MTSAETEITAELVRDLLRDQHPDPGRGDPPVWLHEDLHTRPMSSPRTAPCAA